jgi:hypothetical protein
MIQRFNFYDVYGYLIPGFAVVVMLWLPSAVITQHWQEAKLGWIAAAIAVAYVVGHVLQNLAANAVSLHVVTNAEGKAVLPSPALLDPKDTSLPPDVKRRVQSNVQSWFNIDTSVNQLASGEITKRRDAAFSLCRPIVNARTAYAEQFEGLYTMSRGLFVAFLFSASYMIGWVTACYKVSCAPSVGLFVTGIGLIGLVGLSLYRIFPGGIKNRRPIDLAILVILGLTLAGAGLLAGNAISDRLNINVMLILYAVIGICVTVALRFYLLYRYFAVQFARAVWVSFAAEPLTRSESMSVNATRPAVEADSEESESQGL